ncbi:sulfatase-like hydrolase/transferase [Bacillus sp. 1P02SD]|uniref:sulfatase-like hydrolase/transferase n=1 Tax=Bacillus sp. 1P02SD TaxID=3132264 RepID=UPI0039A38ADA
MNQPNIVFITVDQLRDDFIGVSGNEIVQTPGIDYLARRGIRFTHAFSSHPVCIPARASIMTGMEGHKLGLTEYQEGYELPTNETIPQLLKDSQYQTKVVGKMHMYPERRHYGFESMLLCEEGRRFGQANNEFLGYDDYEMWLAEQGYYGQAFTHGMPNNGYSVTPWHLPDYLHPTDWIGTESCKAIKTRDWTRPLFLWASFTAPHPPLTPLQRDLSLYDENEMPEPVMGNWLEKHPNFHHTILGSTNGENKTKKEIALSYKAYCALITQVDRQINRIIGTLREEGLLENTWFIFTSDHGENLGDHQLWGKRNFLRGSCQVPFIITPPIRGNLDKIFDENWAPGMVSDSVIGLQDILPTCLDIAGVAAPLNVDGRSLLPIVKDQNIDVRDILLGEIGVPGHRSLMVTDGNWKYIWYEEDGCELLFNISSDPYELHDLTSIELSEVVKWRHMLVDILADRDNDRAIVEMKLNPLNSGKKISSVKKARLASDGNLRGIHL